MKPSHISIVTPVYGCCAALRELVSRISSTLEGLAVEFEIIMVNDASPDQSWEVIQELAIEDDRVKGINLSRNFGQHHAIMAGLDFARGDWVVVMDCDLQDQPEEIVKLYSKAVEGFDMVVGRRAERKDSFSKKLASQLFYRVFGYFADTHIDHRIGNFGIYSRKVIQSITKLREQNLSFGIFAVWVGFRRAEIDVEHTFRRHGRSSYSFRKLIRLALDSIVANSNKLLHTFVLIGIIISILSFIYAAELFVSYVLFGVSISGWTSLMFSVYFTTGLTIVIIGVVGIYIGKMFDEIKGRPIYIIDSTTFDVGTIDD